MPATGEFDGLNVRWQQGERSVELIYIWRGDMLDVTLQNSELMWACFDAPEARIDNLTFCQLIELAKEHLREPSQAQSRRRPLDLITGYKV